MNQMQKLQLSILLLFSMLFSLQAQDIDLDKLKNMNMRAIGPAGMSGRVTDIEVVESQPHIIYIGSASGGIWKSESGGINWKPVFDSQATLSIGAIAIQQDNPDVVWAGTGEGNPRNSLNGGYGIYKSLDAGRTWQLMGLEKTRHIHRIVIDKNNPNTVYVGAIGSPWGEHPERGVFKTTDGGKTWKKVLFVDDKTGCADLIADPTNPNKLFAAMWEHRRKPWTFNSGGPGSGLYVTVDGGENWTKLSDKEGLPKGDLGRIGVAVAPSNPKRVYALIESKDNALYRSDDGGYNWKMINTKDDIGNRPFYYSEIYVDPINENRVYSIFTYVNVSEDGGKNFKQLMPAYGTTTGVHPDHHAWWIHPTNPNYMIDGNDGGLNITHDGGKTWRFVENLPLGQFYHVNVDNEVPYNVYGGMQDNGSWAGPAYVWKSQGIRNSYWQEVSFGDGFDVIPDPEDSRYGYSMSQQGYVVRYDRKTGHTYTVRPTHPDPDVRLRFNWNSAISQDPFDKSTIYFGSQFVHKSTDKGRTWEIISPDLTTNDSTKQQQDKSGGLTIDATGAENNTTILVVEPSTLEKGLLWVGTDDGLIHISQDGGANWKDITPPQMPEAGWVAQIKASKHKAGEAVAVVNNYRNFDYKPYLFHTTNYGVTWKSIVSEKQVWNYCLSFIQDPVEPNLMFLGTEGGLYFSIDAGQNWNHWTKDYPNVPTMDLVIQERDNDLVIGTYGRAIYVLDDIQPLRTLAKEGAKLLEEKLVLFAPPTAYHTQWQEPTGTRFGANAIFNGENRTTAARIAYLINHPEKEKKEEEETDKGEDTTEESPKDSLPEVKFDSIRLEVYNEAGELIRTLKRKAPKENGLHTFYWRKDEKGVIGPRRSEPKGSQEPSGTEVLPGIYTLKMYFGDQLDSTTIEVQYDPRVEMPIATLKAKYEMYKRIEKSRALAGEAMKQLRNAKKVAEDYQKRLKDEDAKAYKDLIKSSKTVQDSIEQLMQLFVGEDNSKKQGIIRSPYPSINSRFGTASWYLGGPLDPPGATEERLIEQAEAKLDIAIEKVNEFFKKDWPEYRKAVEAVEFKPFEDYEPLMRGE
jgi:photosystem II stability/assembly factor-like uncharacterized protein